MKLRPSEAFRLGLADVGVLKAQIALPETADELCEVAKSLKVSPEDIFGRTGDGNGLQEP